MNLLAKHHEREKAEVIATYTVTDQPPVAPPIIPCNLKNTNDGIFIFNKIWRGEAPHMIVKLSILWVLSFFAFVLLAETGVIYVSGLSSNTTFFSRYSALIYMLLSYYMIFFIGLVTLTKNLFFVFKGKNAVLYCKKHGTLEFDIKDIRFHLIKGNWPRDMYYLEIEIPTPLLQGYHRMMLIEMAARKETLEGILAALLPLLMGDSEPLKRAKKRRYVPIPAEEKPSLWERNTNWDSHKIVWFNCYVINNIIFWLVHGSRKFKKREMA